MIYEITYIETEKGKKQKLAHPVKNRKALLAKRNSAKNLRLLEKYHQGDAKSKGKLLQLAYNLGYVNGPLAGCKSIGSFFFYDVDCYDKEQSEVLKNQILEKKDAIGLVMLEKSPSGGYHLVCKRVAHTTILENIVRTSCELKIEMDTSAHDLQRVVYSTSGSAEDLIYLDDCIFEEPMTPEECEKEYQLLKERESRGLEEVPAGAKKANKHYRPWEDRRGLNKSTPASDQTTLAGNQTSLAIDQTTPSCGHPIPEQSSPTRSLSYSGGEKVTYPSDYHGIPFTEILKKYWEVNNRGFEPTEGDRDTLTYQLACDLRHICGKNADWLDQVIPCYDGFTPEEKRQKIQSALNSELEAFPARLRNALNALSMDNGKWKMDNEDEGDDGQLSIINSSIIH